MAISPRPAAAVAGRPGSVTYSPPGAQHHRSGAVDVAVYDAATETVYEVQGFHRAMRGANTAPVIAIAIARSLFEGTNPQCDRRSPRSRPSRPSYSG